MFCGLRTQCESVIAVNEMHAKSECCTPLWSSVEFCISLSKHLLTADLLHLAHAGL